MPFLDFFRNIFGKAPATPSQEPPQNSYEDNHQYSDSFRNPIWQNDEDEDDVSDFNRHQMNRYHFRIDSNPFEMTRFFENQMDHILKAMLEGFGNNFGDNSSIFTPFGTDEFAQFGNIERKSNKAGPRDEVMKPEYEIPNSRHFFDGFTNIFTMPERKINKGLCDDVLKPSYEMPDANHQKVDSDIDGKIESNQLAKILKDSSTLEPKKYEPFGGHIFQSGKSVSTQIIRRSDGSIEERRTFRDSSGNEETSVTRQIGDKKHVVITKKAKDGSQEQTEDIINMDENDLGGFNKRWFGYSTPNKPQLPTNNFEDDVWRKFFGPNPKL